MKLQSNLNRKPHFLTSLAPSLFPAMRNKNSSAQISRYLHHSPTSIQKLTLLYDFPSCCHSYLSHSPTSAVPVLSKYIFTMLLLLRALQQNLFGLFWPWTEKKIGMKRFYYLHLQLSQFQLCKSQTKGASSDVNFDKHVLSSIECTIFFFFFQVGFQVLSSIKLSCFFLDLPAF